MLTPIEVEVMQNCGLTPEQMKEARTGHVSVARNSEGGDPLTQAQRQVCEQLGVNELEFMQALTSDGLSDPISKAMIDALTPQEKACCRQMGISEQEFLEVKMADKGNRSVATALNNEKTYIHDDLGAAPKEYTKAFGPLLKF